MDRKIIYFIGTQQEMADLRYFNQHIEWRCISRAEQLRGLRDFNYIYGVTARKLSDIWEIRERLNYMEAYLKS